MWEGSVDELQEFMTHMNNIRYGIKLTGKWSYEEIQYLDLEIFKKGTQLYTGTFFKDVDRNGYISTRSCHHPEWIKAIPKAQFARIRRNCDLDEAYWKQSEILLDRFLEKGFNQSELQKIRLEVSNANHVTNKKKKDNQFDLAFVTGYNVDYKQIEKSVINIGPYSSKIVL